MRKITLYYTSLPIVFTLAVIQGPHIETANSLFNLTGAGGSPPCCDKTGHGSVDCSIIDSDCSSGTIETTDGTYGGTCDGGMRTDGNKKEAAESDCSGSSGCGNTYQVSVLTSDDC